MPHRRLVSGFAREPRVLESGGEAFGEASRGPGASVRRHQSSARTERCPTREH